jgi:two-component system sensor histidine kinase/response regulator
MPRRTVRDLVALSMLPGGWEGYQPPRIAESLADRLLDSLPLDFVYLRLPCEGSGDVIEVARTGHRPTTVAQARELGRALAPRLDRPARGAAEVIPNPLGRGTVRILVVPLGSVGDGVLVAGSQDAGFPSEDDRLLLGVGVNQAAMALQRLRAEQALRENEERTRKLGAVMPVAIYTCDALGRINFYNRRAAELWGRDPQLGEEERKFCGSFRLWRANGSPLPHDQSPMAVAVREGRAVRNMEIVIEQPTGVRVVANVNIDPLFDHEGRRVGSINVFEDITERMHIEEAMRQSEERFRGTFENAAVGIAHRDASGRLLRVNQTYCDIVGYPREELLSRSFKDLTHPADLRAEAERYTALMSGELSNYTLDKRYIRKDGSPIWIDLTVSLQRDAGGRPAYAIEVLEDISERKRAEEALRLANVRLDQAIRVSNIGIWEAEVSGGSSRTVRIVSANFLEFLGHDRLELPLDYESAMAFVHPDDRGRVEHLLQASLNGKTGEFESEHRVRHRDGSYHWVLSRGVAVRDALGNVVRLVGTDQDITDRKRTDAVLRQAKEVAEAANRAKDDFLANVSHEIRTPFGAILGMTELVLDSDLTEDQRQCLTTAKSAADNLLGIINDLLDFSKIEAGKLELDPAPFTLRAALGETLRALAVRAHKKGLELVCHVEPDVPDALVGDVGRLRQVVLNLLSNAIKFTETGEVLLRVGTIGTREIEGEVGLCFAVHDTGIGVPHGKQEAIFRAFEQEDVSTTRKYGGTGLGLTIAARLAALMGGAITLASEPGRGSTFTFTARFGCRPRAEERAPARSPVALRDLPVLIVDDNATNRQILGEWLDHWGMKPAAVADAPAAIDALRNAAACGRPYALVLLDVMMPGTDGLTLAAQIRERAELSATHVILMTSGERPRDEVRIRALRIEAHLLKPVPQNDLLEAIYRVMGRRDGDLPPARALAEPQAQAAMPLSILVAEDNEFNLRHLERLLVRKGHRVQMASNGREALDLAGSSDFDVMLLDLHMPVLDGFQVARAIRERERIEGHHLPVIALTARSRQEDRESCLAAGMDDYLAKPIRAAALFAAIDRSVRTPGPSRPAPPEARHRASLLAPATLLAACGGDGDDLRKLCEDFQAYAPARLAEVGYALRDQAAPRLREAAHRLCGLLSAFSTVAGNVASDLEDHAARGQLDEARPLVGWLEGAAEELIRQVDGVSLESLERQAGCFDESDPAPWT